MFVKAGAQALSKTSFRAFHMHRLTLRSLGLYQFTLIKYAIFKNVNCCPVCM